MPTRRCCCGVLCDAITELWDTGEEYTGTNIEGYSDPHGPCATDDHWTADGVPAIVVVIYPDGLGPPDDRSEGEGCTDQVLGITAVCSVNSGGAPYSNEGKTVIEPGGPDGAEVLFETEFEIPANVDLDRIAFCGIIAFDNYVPEGEWKVNGIDQVHNEHGSYDEIQGGGLGMGNSIECRTFSFTKETANLVHGTNTIAITVKNGNWAADPGFGGPLFLQMKIYCVERLPCNLNSNRWRVVVEFDPSDDTTEILVWGYDEQFGTTNCACYCVDGPAPTSEPLYEGQTEDVPCEEIPT